MFLIKFLRSVGNPFLDLFISIGRFSIFVGHVLFTGIRPPFYFRQFLKQFIEFGYFSAPIIGLTTFLTGMTLSIQIYSGFLNISSEEAMSTIIVLSMTRELSPILTGLMIAGRIGSSIAAEIGTMKVSEQIDAIFVLSTDPIKYLIIPRFLAGIFSLPILVLVGDVIGIFGGYFISVYKFGFNASNYTYHTLECLKKIDVISGLIKSVVFGFFIVLLGCYQGFFSKGGAKGVGSAATNTVVLSAVSIFLLNYILTITLIKVI